MGSLCGKETPFSGHVPPASSRTSLLPNFISKKPKVGGPGRTLSSSSDGYGEIEGTDRERSTPVDARAAAALAAERRFNAATQKNGKLAAQLEQQKRKTQGQHIRDRNGRQEQLVWD